MEWNGGQEKGAWRRVGGNKQAAGMGVKEKERNQEKVTGELMETEKEWAKEGIQHEGTRKSCAEREFHGGKKDAAGARGQRQRKSPAELSRSGASETRLVDVGRRCLGFWEAIGKIGRPSPPPTS